MAKLINESHEDVLKSHGYVNKKKNNHSTSYSSSDGHSVTVYPNGSWSHFDPKGHYKGNISNPDTGILLRDYLNSYHKKK